MQTQPTATVVFSKQANGQFLCKPLYDKLFLDRYFFEYLSFVHRSPCPNFTYFKKSNTVIEECLKQREIKQYTKRIENIEMQLPSNYSKNISGKSKANSGLLFFVSFPSKVTNIHEEILIFNDTGLIGSLGGSLGLFVGFSIFGYIITFLDVILDKCAEW